MYENETSWKDGMEGFYSGNQHLDNADKTPSFRTFDAIVEKQFGHLFTEIYAPLEGVVGNIALRFRL